MKYILAFLFFYTLGTQGYSFSLTQNDSTTFVNKAAEGIPKLVYAFMEDYKSAYQDFGEGEIDKNEKKGMKLFKSNFLDGYNNFDNSAELFDSIDSFLANKENGWSFQGHTIFKALRENYESERSSASYNLKAVLNIGDKTNIYIKKLNQNKNDEANWDEVSNIYFGNQSKQEFDEVKEKQLNSNDTYQNITSNSGYTEETSLDKNPSNLFNYLIYFGVFVFGFLCASIFFNYKIRKLLGDKYYPYKRIYQNDHGGFSIISFDALYVLKEKKKSYQEMAESKLKPTTNIESSSGMPEWRKKELENSRQQYKKPQNQAESIQEKTAPTVDLEVGSNKDGYQNSSNEKKLNVLYFSAPEQDGSFLLDNSSSTATSRSYYKIEFFDDENIGKLIYRSGNLDKSALSQMDFILSPVCDIENSSMTNPSIVNVESHGSVIKEDNFWIISKKIKIKLS